jgi:hypothetical protein
MIDHAPFCATRMGAPPCTCGAIVREAARLAREQRVDPRPVTAETVRRVITEEPR